MWPARPMTDPARGETEDVPAGVIRTRPESCGTDGERARAHFSDWPRYVFVATCAVLLLGATPARAQSDSERAVARDLFHEADELQRAGHYPDALARFEKAQRLVSAPTNLVRIAQCDAALDHLLEAAEAYRAAIRTPLPPDAPTALSRAQDQAREELALLEPRVPKVTLAITPPNAAGLEIHIDGHVLNVAAVGQPVPLDPGSHVIAISAGRACAERHIELQEHDVKRVTVVLDERAELSGPPAARPPYLAIGLGAAGAVGLVVGAVFGLKASSAYHDALDHHCPTGPTSCDAIGVSEGRDAHSNAAVSTVAFIAGGALAASGAVLYLATSRNVTVGIGPSMLIGGGGVALRGRW